MRRSFRLDREDNDTGQQLRQVAGFLMLGSIPVLLLTLAVGMLAEGPREDGRIHSAADGTLIPWFLPLSIVFYFIGTRWISGRRLIEKPTVTEGNATFGCLAIVAMPFLLVGAFSLMQMLGMTKVIPSRSGNPGPPLINAAIGLALLALGDRIRRAAKQTVPPEQDGP